MPGVLALQTLISWQLSSQYVTYVIFQYLDELEIVGQSLSNDKEEDNIFVDKVDIASELSEATQLDDGLS